MCGVYIICWSLVSFEKRRHDLESTIDKLQQQVDAISERSLQNENKLKLALHNEKLSHDADLQRLTADKVTTTVLLLLLQYYYYYYYYYYC